MCGILAIATTCGTRLPITDGEGVRMRDAMAHRGPDGAGIWWAGDRSVCLAHRRLAVLGLGHAADQPMSLARSADGSITLVYNGEWYDEPRARRGLERRGVSFGTSCDTETLLHALSERGDAALDSIRGMYALAWHDATARTLTIARDPMGIKPVYWMRLHWRGVEQVVVASEPTALLAHPGATPEPDWAMVSAYISHSRAVLGDRTMFRGIHALLPGQIIEFDLGAAGIGERRRTIPLLAESESAGPGSTVNEADGVDALRRALRSSVFRHLRADVPTCALLSGGLDSTVLVDIARERASALRTFAAGPAPTHPNPADPDATRLVEADDDLSVAARVAAEFDLPHEQARLDAGAWSHGWREMIDRLGVPMSTPNEVAIHAVAQRLRGAGCVVTLSGEGADELLLGYAGPLHAIAGGIASGAALDDPAGFAMGLSTWISDEHKPMLLREHFWRAADGDAPRRDAFERALDSAAGWFAPGPDESDAAFARQAGALARTNLSALLRRLDTATMLAGVEGRTPFADRCVARAALRIGAAMHFDPSEPGAMQTKRLLRRAFAGRVPAFVMRRAKASFPIPFQRWLALSDAPSMLRRSGFLREIYHDETIELVAADPLRNWTLAWPMANLAAWAHRWGWDAPASTRPIAIAATSGEHHDLLG
ncbi:MAG: asparagine synthase (glutamine-hydrolyzing) [Phycisphaerales bacterium]